MKNLLKVIALLAVIGFAMIACGSPGGGGGGGNGGSGNFDDLFFKNREHAITISQSSVSSRAVFTEPKAGDYYKIVDNRGSNEEILSEGRIESVTKNGNLFEITFVPFDKSKPSFTGTLTPGGIVITDDSAGNKLIIHDGEFKGTFNDLPEITITGIPSRYIGWLAELSTSWRAGNNPYTAITSNTITFDWAGSLHDYIGLNLRDSLGYDNSLWDSIFDDPDILFDIDYSKRTPYGVHPYVMYNTSQRHINARSNTIPFSDFLNNTHIVTITDIPDKYNNWVGLQLSVSSDLNFTSGGPGCNPRVIGNSITFNLGIDSGYNSDWAKDCYLFLDISNEAGDRAGYRSTTSILSSPNTGLGRNSNIPWSALTEVPTITITGIPNTVPFFPLLSNSISIHISTPGMESWSGHGATQALTFYDWVYDNPWYSSILWNANPGVYDVRFYVMPFGGSGHKEDFIAEYHTSSRNIITGNNIIPFSVFTPQQ
jgi:hypothetical protein